MRVKRWLDPLRRPKLLDPQKWPALAGYTISSDWITKRISAGEINHTMLIQLLNIVISLNCNLSSYHVMAFPGTTPLQLVAFSTV